MLSRFKLVLRYTIDKKIWKKCEQNTRHIVKNVLLKGIELKLIHWWFYFQYSMVVGKWIGNCPFCTVHSLQGPKNKKELYMRHGCYTKWDCKNIVFPPSRAKSMFLQCMGQCWYKTWGFTIRLRSHWRLYHQRIIIAGELTYRLFYAILLRQIKQQHGPCQIRRHLLMHFYLFLH